jgi:hypothetical protein
MSYPSSNFESYSLRVSNRKECETFIKAHYLRRWPGVTVLILAIYRTEVRVGCIVFSLPPRETMVRYKVTLAWELARLYLEDSEPFNSETWAISQAFKFIKRNFQKVELIVSYADPSVGHRGVIYKAANFICDGRTDQERKTPRFDYGVNGKIYSRRSHVPEGSTIVRIPRVSKFRYIYRLRKVAHE